MLDEPTSLRIEDPGVRALFTEHARLQSWLDVEAALAEAQAELGRHVERLRGCEDRVFVAMLAGGAGTLASLGGPGLATQEKMAAKLGVRPMPVPARTIGDHQAEYVLLLGMLAATCGKIGREIYTLMKQEFGEVEEPVPPGTVGSSTMPQKRNPTLSQDIIAAAAQIRALVPLALDAMQTEHEADHTTSIMMSRALVQACELTGDMLQRMISLFDGLQVFPERMRATSTSRAA
jgi:adenylosuccinate lyase